MTKKLIWSDTSKRKRVRKVAALFVRLLLTTDRQHKKQKRKQANRAKKKKKVFKFSFPAFCSVFHRKISQNSQIHEPYSMWSKEFYTNETCHILVGSTFIHNKEPIIVRWNVKNCYYFVVVFEKLRRKNKCRLFDRYSWPFVTPAVSICVLFLFWRGPPWLLQWTVLIFNFAFILVIDLQKQSVQWRMSQAEAKEEEEEEVEVVRFKVSQVMKLCL